MNTLSGMGYSALLLAGYNAMPVDAMGGYWVLPPGSAAPPFSPALIWLEPVMPQFLPVLLQTYYNFDNPMVAMSNAQSLGLMNVLGVAPLRQTNLNGASALVREFDGMSANGTPMRMSGLLLQGPTSALQVIVGINLYMWVQFAGPSMQFLAGIRLQGTAQVGGDVRSVIDPNNLGQVQVQVVNSDSSVAQIMTLPTDVEGQKVFHIHVEAGGTVRFGDVKGTSVQIGDHNTSSTYGGQNNQTLRQVGGMR